MLVVYLVVYLECYCVSSSDGHVAYLVVLGWQWGLLMWGFYVHAVSPDFMLLLRKYLLTCSKLLRAFPEPLLGPVAYLGFLM